MFVLGMLLTKAFFCWSCILQPLSHYMIDTHKYWAWRPIGSKSIKNYPPSPSSEGRRKSCSTRPQQFPPQSIPPPPRTRRRIALRRCGDKPRIFGGRFPLRGWGILVWSWISVMLVSTCGPPAASRRWRSIWSRRPACSLSWRHRWCRTGRWRFRMPIPLRPARYLWILQGWRIWLEAGLFQTCLKSLYLNMTHILT